MVTPHKQKMKKIVRFWLGWGIFFFWFCFVFTQNNILREIPNSSIVWHFLAFKMDILIRKSNKCISEGIWRKISKFWKPCPYPVVSVAHHHYVDEAYLNTFSWQPVCFVDDWLAPWMALIGWCQNEFSEANPSQQHRPIHIFRHTHTDTHRQAHWHYTEKNTHTNTGVFSVCPPHCLNVNYMLKASGPVHC